MVNDSESQEKYRRWLERKKSQSNIADNYSEQLVITHIAEMAKIEDWKEVEKHVILGETGTDLKLEKEARRIVLQAKGERPSQRTARSRVESALGQILMDMREIRPDDCYCLAFPATDSFKKAVGLIPTQVRRNLQLNIILVDCLTGTSSVLRPNDQQLVVLNHFNQLFD